MPYRTKIKRPKTGKVTVTVAAPDNAPRNYARDLVASYLPEGTRIEGGYIYPSVKVSRSHLDRLVRTMPRPLLLKTEHVCTVQLEGGCTEACAHAKPETAYLCTCRCGGRHHARGDAAPAQHVRIEGTWVQRAFL